MAALYLAPGNRVGGDAVTCAFGCCGGRHDFASTKAARRAARRREAAIVRREVREALAR